MHPKRRVFEKGHHRKFMVVIDDSPEFEVALYFAARVAHRTKGRLVMLYVDEPVKTGGWFDIKSSAPDHRKDRAEAEIDKFRSRLDEMGMPKIRTEAITRTGDKAEEIIRVIDRDEDIAVLVLGASVSRRGPGPLVTSLVTGEEAGTFPVPIYIVPGDLTFDEISALA
jgi:nucleotide-binding universal stress UspA family protein